MSKIVRIGGNEVATKMIGDQVWVNLTEMGAPFGRAKAPGQWLRNTAAEEYVAAANEQIETESRDANMHFGENEPKTAVFSKRGGESQGTWAHELVAIAYAQFLSPAYYVQCNRAILELHKKGEVKVAPRPVLPFGNSKTAQARKKLADEWGGMGELLREAGWSNGAVQGEFLHQVAKKELEYNVEIVSPALKLTVAKEERVVGHTEATSGRIIEAGGESILPTELGAEYDLSASEMNIILKDLGWQVSIGGGKWTPVGLGDRFSNNMKPKSGKHAGKKVIHGWKGSLVRPHITEYIKNASK